MAKSSQPKMIQINLRKVNFALLNMPVAVDDGKSTLIGRMLYDARAVLDDQLLQSRKESDKYGTQGNSLDLALLVDGLQAEREQGITIDVAYRFLRNKGPKVYRSRHTRS